MSWVHANAQDYSTRQILAHSSLEVGCNGCRAKLPINASFCFLRLSGQVYPPIKDISGVLPEQARLHPSEERKRHAADFPE